MRRRLATERGFTIIEILVVVAIIVVLAGILVAVGTSVRQSAQLRQTRSELKILDAVMKDYLGLHQNELPKSIADMSSFVGAVKVYPQFEKTLNELPGKAYTSGTNSVKDAFGFDIAFVKSTTADASSFFRSVGPDGLSGTPDDLQSNELAH